MIEWLGENQLKASKVFKVKNLEQKDIDKATLKLEALKAKIMLKVGYSDGKVRLIDGYISKISSLLGLPVERKENVIES